MRDDFYDVVERQSRATRKMSKKGERKMTQGGRIKRKRRKVRITRYARSERQTKVRMTRRI